MKEIQIDKDFVIAVESAIYWQDSHLQHKKDQIQIMQDNIVHIKREIKQHERKLSAMEKFFEQVGVEFPRTITITEEELIAALNE